MLSFGAEGSHAFNLVLQTMPGRGAPPLGCKWCRRRTCQSVTRRGSQPPNPGGGGRYRPASLRPHEGTVPSFDLSPPLREKLPKHQKHLPATQKPRPNPSGQWAGSLQLPGAFTPLLNTSTPIPLPPNLKSNHQPFTTGPSESGGNRRPCEEHRENEAWSRSPPSPHVTPA